MEATHASPAPTDWQKLRRAELLDADGAQDAGPGTVLTRALAGFESTEHQTAAWRAGSGLMNFPETPSLVGSGQQ